VRALFLDRDGVINVNHGHVGTVDRFEFIPGAFELAREANRRGYLVIVVTNQAGIAKGYYSEQQFLDLMSWMGGEFEKRHAHIDGVYYCPHHPEAGLGPYKQACACRKPAPGMLLSAANERQIDLRQSIFIGDSETDRQAADAAGIGKFLFFGRAGASGAMEFSSLTDYAQVFRAAVEQ